MHGGDRTGVIIYVPLLAPVSSGQASSLYVGLFQIRRRYPDIPWKLITSLIAELLPFCHTLLHPFLYFPLFPCSWISIQPQCSLSLLFSSNDRFLIFFHLRVPKYQSTFSTFPMIFSSKIGKTASSSRTSSNTTPQSNSSLTFLK